MTKKKKRNVLLSPNGVKTTKNKGSSAKATGFKAKNPTSKAKNNHKAARGYMANLSTTSKKKLTQKKNACPTQKGMLRTELAPKQGWDGNLRDPVPPSIGDMYQLSGNLYEDGHTPLQGHRINEVRIRPYIGSGFNETEQEDGPSSVNMRQFPDHGWNGNCQYPVPTYGDENLLLESSYEEVQPNLQAPGTSQGRKRSFIDDSDDEPNHLDKRRRLSEYCWDGNNGYPEPLVGSNRNQILGGSLGQAQDSFQISSNDQGRKRPYIGNGSEGASRCTTVEPHVEKRRRLSTGFTYQLNDDLNNHQPNNYEFEKNGAKWTCKNSREKQLGTIDEGSNKQCSNTEESVTYKLAIVTSDYPATLFKLEQFDTVQMAIFEKLESTPDPLPIVHLGHMNNLGAIPVTCEGRISANFLFSFDGKVIDGDIKLKIIDAADLPKPIKMAWRSRNTVCQDLNRVMRMLQRCNPVLRTALWRVLNTVSETQSVRRIVIMDCVSAEYIKSKNYSIPDGLARSKFKLFDGPKSKRGGVSEGTSYNKVVLETGVDKCPQNNLQGYEVIGSNYPQNDLEGYVMEEGDPQPSQSMGGDLDCSLLEIRDPLVTIDLTEGYSSCEDEENFTGEL